MNRGEKRDESKRVKRGKEKTIVSKILLVTHSEITTSSIYTAIGILTVTERSLIIEKNQYNYLYG